MTAYTTGVLSTRVIPSSYILAMLVGIPSNAYILPQTQSKAFLHHSSLPEPGSVRPAAAALPGAACSLPLQREQLDIW